MKISAPNERVLSDKTPLKNDLPFSIDPTVFSQKLSNREIEKLQWIPVKGSVEDILTHASSGRAFTLGIYQGNHRNSKKLTRQQVFGVDFDDGMTLKEVEAILKEYDLSYNGGYYSYSHSANHEKFRLLFVFDGEVQHPDLVKAILKGFYYLFNCRSDKTCIDAARYWNGTDKGYFIGHLNQEISLQYFQEITTPLLLAADRNQWRSIVLADKGTLCAETGKLIYNINKNTQTCTIETEKDIRLIENVNIEDLFKFKLFKTFYEGRGTTGKGNKLSHDELFGIATNLIQIKGGSSIWKDCLAKNANYAKDKFSIFNYVRHENYAPIHFAKFSPYEEDKRAYYQTFRTLLAKKGRVTEKTTSIKSPAKKLDEARNELIREYNKALAFDDCDIYIIKCATGLGKTELIKNTPNIVAAFPDHELKNEHHNSSKLIRDKKLVTPAVEGFSDDVQKHFDALYKVGFNDVVNTLIKNLASGTSINIGTECLAEDTRAAQAYLEMLERAKKSDNDETVFTTHQRAILTSFSQPTIVYDESPLNVLLATGDVPVKDVETLIAHLYLNSEEDLAKRLRELINSNSEDVYELSGIDIDEGKIYGIIKKLKLKSKIWDFLKSDYYVKINNRICYCTNNAWKLPADKKIIIADATAPLELYRKLFGNRLKEIDISNVDLRGEIIQYTNRSCSRQQNKVYGHKINADLDDWPTITFKSQKFMFDNSTDDIHFGKCRGTNKYEGKNLNVIGTPNYGGAFYRFLAKVCGLEVDDFTMRNRTVNYNNKEFTFYTVENKELQQLHLELTEGDIIQAVHRARPIIYNVIIKVYSNLPIPNARLVWWENNKPEIDK